MNTAIFKTLLPLLIALGIPLGALAQETALRPNDTVILKIAGVPVDERQEIDGPYPVSDAGTIHLPYIGSVRAAGMKPTDLARKIEGAYRSAEIYTKPNITIVPPEGDPGRRVTVIGEVRASQGVPYTDGLTLLDAIASCGGFTDFADTKHVRLIRDGKPVEYNMKDITSNPENDVRLRPGDKVVVPK